MIVRKRVRLWLYPFFVALLNNFVENKYYYASHCEERSDVAISREYGRD